MYVVPSMPHLPFPGDSMKSHIPDYGEVMVGHGFFDNTQWDHKGICRHGDGILIPPPIR